MSVLPTNADFSLLSLFWGVSMLFLGVSFLLCLAIILRRILRNQKASKRKRQKADFQLYINEIINKDISTDRNLLGAPDCHIQDMTDVFLHYFRTLRGKKLEYLQDLISQSDIESRIIHSSYKGIRGSRMRAVRTLSYLNTQSSLQVIFENLSSNDKYVRLTAARCLVRRKGFCFLSDIINACNEAFPNDYQILAGILAAFGTDIIEPLENLIRRSNDSVVKTACLEALILIMPPFSSLDFEALMQDENETVRAAALSLSAIVDHEGIIEPLLLGLQDQALPVKIRAVKIACKLKRSDVTPQLYQLSTDPAMWVRYWALRAIWVTGQSGQQFVNSLIKTNPMAANVALEMKSGYV